MGNMTKICTKCSEEKTADAFYKNKNATDGLYSYCKQCHKKCVVTWCNNHKDKHRSYVMTWAENNKERQRSYSAKSYRKKMALLKLRNE